MFCFWDKCIWIVRIELSLLIREYLSSTVNVLQKVFIIFMSLRVTFPTQLPSQWSMNMVKTLALRLNQCFGPFTMSPVEGSSQRGPFRHLLIREYLSSAVNVLPKSLHTFHVTKSDFSNSITFKVINEYGNGASVKIESVFRPVYHVACRGVLSNGTF